MYFLTITLMYITKEKSLIQIYLKLLPSVDPDYVVINGQCVFGYFLGRQSDCIKKYLDQKFVIASLNLS